ncbi:MAG TPA: response regulator [Myxococcales bacterium]|nr:response regulator [Myxococcales bacterium]
MPLVLEYPDKYRLWSDLIQGHNNRVFIPTDEAPSLGGVVQVTLSLPGLPLQIAIEGAVIGRRPRSERFPPGVYLRFSDEQMDKCRRFLGLSQSPERYEQGRKAKRARCELKLELVEPRAESTGVAKNLSETGLLLVAPCELTVGQEVEARLSLEEGDAVDVRAEVSWARNDKRLVGLRFLEMAPEAQRRIRGQVQKLLERPSSGPPRSQILVADDEPNVLEFLTKALNKHGYDVRKASRGEEALDLVRQLRPELVIMDILMPGIDGVDICQMMRADVEMADIPVVFLSALESQRLHEVADEAGATDYLCKPVNLADLLNMVGRYLKR